MLSVPRLMPRLVWGLLTICCLLTAGAVTAEEAPAKSPAKKAAKAAIKSAAIDAKREQQLLDFVQEHHAELAELLSQLKPMNSAQYRAALKDLDRDVRRLENLRKRTPDDFQPELGLWQARSRIRLLAARLTMSSDEELKNQLRSELRSLRRLEAESVSREIAATKSMLEKQQKKLQQLDRRAAELQGDDDSWVDRKLAELEREQQKAAADATEKPAKPKEKSKPKPDKKKPETAESSAAGKQK